MKGKTTALLLLTASLLVPGISVNAYASDTFEAVTNDNSAVISFSSEDASDSFSSPEQNEEFIDGNALIQDTQEALAASADTTSQDISIDEEHFPDENLRKYLSSPERDKNQDGILQAEEIAAIKEVEIGYSIDPAAVTQACKYLTAVEHMKLYINDYFDKDVYLDMSALQELVQLSVTGSVGSVTHLDLSSNSKLQTLEVGCNVLDIHLPKQCSITDYSAICCENMDEEYSCQGDSYILDTAAQLPGLEVLSLKYFTDEINVDFSGWPNLRELSITGEHYWVDSADAGTLQLGSFDLSGNPQLQTLSLHDVIVPSETLDLSGCPLLEKVSAKQIYTPDASTHYNKLIFFNLIKHPLAKVEFNQFATILPEYMSTGGYFEMKNMTTWKPDRIIPQVSDGTPGLTIIGSRLYPPDLYFSEDYFSFSYYLDEEKTVTANYGVTLLTNSPKMVSGLTITAKTPTSLTCKWNQNKDYDYDGYVLYLQDSVSRETLKRIKVKKGTNTQTITGLLPGQRYLLVVRAYKTENGKTYYSPHYAGNVICYTAPKTPALQASAKSGRKVQLKWKASPATYRDSDSGYILYYKKGAKGTYKRLAVISDTSNSFTTSALSKGSTYYFKARSYIRDTATGENHQTFGSYSKEVKITIK